MSDYTLHLGDCLEVLPEIPDRSVDCICADPPYGVTSCRWDAVIPFEPMWAQLKRIIKPRGAIVLFGSQPFTSALVMSNVKWFRYEWVWKKNMPTGSLNAQKQPMRSHESILVFAEGSTIYNPQKVRRTPEEFKAAFRTVATIYGNRHGVYGQHDRSRVCERAPIDEQWYRYPDTVLTFPRDEKRDGSNHPTQKPVALLEYLVRTYTNEGDTVLDFAFGSNTTGVACMNTGRKYIGIEKDADYFAIGQKRIFEATQQLRMELAV